MIRVYTNSGGRTSGFLVRKAQLAGGLAKEDFVLFYNTGKEREETLEFVRRQETVFGYKITWLQYRNPLPWYDLFLRPDFDYANWANYKSLDEILNVEALALIKDQKEFQRLVNTRKDKRHEVVCFETANRIGKPFIDRFLYVACLSIIKGRKPYLPTPLQRWCSGDLKEKTSERFLKSIGIREHEKFLGIRIDEEHRAARIRNNNRDSTATLSFPLIKAKINKDDIYQFWAEQEFDLKLNSYEGNCDFCFMKTKKKKLRLIQEARFDLGWWNQFEILTGDSFLRNHGSINQLIQKAAESPLISDIDILDDFEQQFSCLCGED